MTIPLGERRYVPRGASNTLKLIVEEHLEELRHVYDDRFRETYGPLPQAASLTAVGHDPFLVALRTPQKKKTKMSISTAEKPLKQIEHAGRIDGTSLDLRARLFL